LRREGENNRPTAEFSKEEEDKEKRRGMISRRHLYSAKIGLRVNDEFNHGKKTGV